MRRGGWRSALLNLALLTGSVMAFGGFLELALRVAFARSLDFSMEMWKYAVALKRPSADPKLGFTHRPNTSAFLMGVPFAINSAGLRDREYAREKGAGVYRIVWLGDSTTVGWGVPLGGTAPKILEKKLNGGGRGRYEVLNAGVGNYDTVQEAAHYLAVDRAFHPDLVILEYFINDAEPVPHERSMGWFGHSYLAAFAVSRLDAGLRLAGVRPGWREYYASLYREGSAGLDDAGSALGQLAKSAAADGAKLLVLVLPELHELNGKYPFEKEMAKVGSLLTARGIRYLDLLGCLRGRGPETDLWITAADAHPNAKANELIAECVVGAGL